MKKKSLAPKIFSAVSAVFCTVFLFSACGQFSGMAVPEKISVKTDAEFSLALGEKDFDVGARLGDELMEKLSKAAGTETSAAKIYKYIPDPGDDTLRYLFHKKIYDFRLDVGSYLDDIELDELLSSSGAGVTLEQEINLPKIDEDKTISYDASQISGDISKGMKDSLEAGKVVLSSVPEPGDSITEAQKNLAYAFTQNGKANFVSISFDYAQAVQFTDDSKILIKVTQTDSKPVSSDFEFTFKASIAPTADFAGTETGPEKSIRQGVTEFELPLSDGSGGKIASVFQIDLNGKYAGGTYDASHEHSYTIEFGLSNGAGFKYIYDIDPTAGATPLSLDIPVSPQSFDLSGIGSFVKSAEIGSGKISIGVDAPQNWTGVSFDWGSFSLSGSGLNLDKTDFTDTNDGTYLIKKELDFAAVAGSRKTLDFSLGNTIDFSGTIKMNLANATIYLGEDGKSNAAVKGNVKIFLDTISSASADFSELLDFEMNSSSTEKKQLPLETVKYLKQITFGQLSGSEYYKSDSAGNISSTPAKGIGITCNIINTLPSGNDIPLTLSSSIFNINSTTLGASPVVPSGTDAVAGQNVNWVAYPTVNFTGPYSEAPYIDMKISLPQSHTITNLKLGEKYKFAIKNTKFVFDWDKIIVNIKALGNVSDNVQGELDVSSLSINTMLEGLGSDLSEFIKKLNFEKLPLYIFVQKPSDSIGTKLGSVALKGKLTLSYKDPVTSAVDTKYYIGTAATEDVLAFAPLMSWPDTVSLTKKFTAADYSSEEDLAPVLNTFPDSIKMGYSVAIGGGSESDITFYRTEFDAIRSQPDASTSISIDMAVEIPMSLKMTEDTKLDILKLAQADTSSTKDLMNRSSVSTTEEFAKYAASVKYFRVRYNLNNAIINDFNAQIIIDDTHSGEADASDYSGISKTHNFTAKDISDDCIEFSGSEIENALTKFFMPKMYIEIKNGTKLTLSRSGMENSGTFGIKPVVELKLDKDSPVCITDIMDKK